jgi:hypothetical protein
MTTKPKTRKAKATASAPKRRRARAITEAGFAAADFEPWQGEINTKCLPDNEQFTEDGLFHLITCRMALVMMYRTSSKMGTTCADWSRTWEVRRIFSRTFPSFLTRPRPGSSPPGPAFAKTRRRNAASVVGNGGTPNAARPPSLSHLEASRAVLGLAAAGTAARGGEFAAKNKQSRYCEDDY